jgi:hypothetical protein
MSMIIMSMFMTVIRAAKLAQKLDPHPSAYIRTEIGSSSERLYWHRNWILIRALELAQKLDPHPGG